MMIVIMKVNIRNIIIIIKWQGKESNQSTKIIQINRSIKPSNSALDIKEKKEKIEISQREILNSKTPERLIIVNKSNNLNIKNVIKQNNSPQIIKKILRIILINNYLGIKFNVF